MIIDSHAHAWASWPYEPAVPDPSTRGTLEQLTWEMDRNGVDGAVIIAARIDHNPGNNEYVAEAVRAHQGRLHLFCDVDSKWSPKYHTPGAARRLRDAAARFACKGFTHYLGQTNDGWLRSADGIAFFEVAAELNMVASVAGPPIWQEDLRAIARRTPSLPILCHHLAGLASWTGTGVARACVPQILRGSQHPDQSLGVLLWLSNALGVPASGRNRNVSDTLQCFRSQANLLGVRPPGPAVASDDVPPVARDPCEATAPLSQARIWTGSLGLL